MDPMAFFLKIPANFFFSHSTIKAKKPTSFRSQSQMIETRKKKLRQPPPQNSHPLDFFFYFLFV